MISGLFGLALILIIIGLPGPGQAEDVASYMYRYGEREVSTGYYDAYEVKPFVQLRGGPVSYKGATTQGLNSSGQAFQWRAQLNDSHWGLKSYERRECVDCHSRQAWDRHTVRAGIKCHQCHGKDPIAGINHSYSPVNPIRRHSYVCAKCHEGASSSFATYTVHEPAPASLRTWKTFPLLFYAFWMMIAIAGGTFAVFLPHTALWGMRELLMKKEDADAIEEQE